MTWRGGLVGLALVAVGCARSAGLDTDGYATSSTVLLPAPTSIGDIGVPLSVMVLVAAAVLVWPPAPEPVPVAPGPDGRLMRALREYVARRG